MRLVATQCRMLPSIEDGGWTVRLNTLTLTLIFSPLRLQPGLESGPGLGPECTVLSL